jgi:general secretion pathway protein M
MQQILDWFRSLNPRERVLVVGGGIVVAVAAIYFFALAPFYRAVDARAQSVAKKEADLAWMQSVAPEVRQATASGPRASSSGESLVVLIARTSQECGVGSALTGQTPRGDSTMSVRLEGAEFDKLVVCLGNWQQSYAVMVQEANFDRTAKSGVVNASLTLNRGG